MLRPSFLFRITQFFSIPPLTTTTLCPNFLPRFPTNREVRGQTKNLEYPRLLFLVLRLSVAKVLQSTISAPVCPRLSQRKGIQLGRPQSVSQSVSSSVSLSPETTEMGASVWQQWTRVSWPPDRVSWLHAAATTWKLVFICTDISLEMCFLWKYCSDFLIFTVVSCCHLFSE